MPRVGTSFLIGGVEQNNGTKWDGKIYRAFHELYWSHHLGLGSPYNRQKIRDRSSIGIEICNYGPLTKEDGKFYFVTETKKGIYKRWVPDNQVLILEKPWRGNKYFQKITNNQIE